MTAGLISLIYKAGPREDLSNWRPITLLNTSYKILAKALQLRIKPHLADLIDPDQTAFVPMRSILDNVFVTHETISLAKRSWQPLLFLKVDFSKAFDKVNWDFLFRCMSRFGFNDRYINLVKLLFVGASAAVNLNGSRTESFPILRGLRQGCPLAPSLFIMVAEVLNILIKDAEREGRIKGIQLPNSQQTQIISQFADDTSMTIDASNPDSIRDLIYILDTFWKVTGLEINWLKSHAYWLSPMPKPPWLENIGWRWAQEKDLLKLLGTPFGIDPSSDCIDQFLISRVTKKLSYRTAQKLSLVGRALIVKQVLFSTLWIFVSVWQGTVKALAKVKSLLRNFLWSGKEFSARARVNWRDCCVKRKAGGLSLIDPHAAMTGLLGKWVMLAYAPGCSNIQVLLRDKLWFCSPHKEAHWPANPQWGLAIKHTSKAGSKT